MALRAVLIMTVQLNGFFKVVYIINGNLLAPSCGYAENVCYFDLHHATTAHHVSFL